MDGAIMRILNLLFSTLVITSLACSSSNKNSSSSDSSVAASSAESESSPVAKSKANSDSARTESAAPVANALVEAIKAQNEESIYKAATSALLLNANDVRALNALGLYNYRKGRPLAARLLFSKALQLQPNSSELYSNIGLTYLATKDEAEAIRSFKKAIEVNAADTSATTNLASIYLEHRDFNKAFSVLTLNAGRPKDIKFLINSALVYQIKEKPEQAESLYKEALKISQTNKELLLNYAIFQIEYQKKFREGLETLDRLKLLGLGEGMKNITNGLENRAKAGLK